MPARAKELRFETLLERDGSFRAGGDELQLPEEWTAEDLVLAGLLRCSVTSLRYAAGRAGLEVGVATATARGTVTRREEDGRYAFVEVAVEVVATLEPAPDESTRADVLARAERGCFVGASLTAKPAYSWVVT